VNEIDSYEKKEWIHNQWHPQRGGNESVIVVEPNDRSKKAQILQDKWFEQNEGKRLKFARENVRHPDA